MNDEPYIDRPVGVFVTLADIYVKITAIELAVTPLPAKVEDLEHRTRRLEKALWMVAGFSAAGGTAAGATLTRLLGG